MASENSMNVKKMNEAVADLVGKVFGEQGADVVRKTGEQVQTFSAKAIKGLIDFTDNLLTTAKLDGNDLIKKSRDSVHDLLRQTGLLEEHAEEDF